MSDPTPSLTEFLLARLAEDEHDFDVPQRDPRNISANYDDGYIDALHARLLAECAAKRQIIRLHKARGVQGRDAWTCVVCDHAPVPWEAYLTYPCPTLLALAAPFVDHPDFPGGVR